jgi:uncharacterized membrane protein
MNPFDLKAALLAKHAQHPVIIHFPIALFIASLAFDFLAIWREIPHWQPLHTTICSRRRS